MNTSITGWYHWKQTQTVITTHLHIIHKVKQFSTCHVCYAVCTASFSMDQIHVTLFTRPLQHWPHVWYTVCTTQDVCYTVCTASSEWARRVLQFAQPLQHGSDVCYTVCMASSEWVRCVLHCLHGLFRMGQMWVTLFAWPLQNGPDVCYTVCTASSEWARCVLHFTKFHSTPLPQCCKLNLKSGKVENTKLEPKQTPPTHTHTQNYSHRQCGFIKDLHENLEHSLWVQHLQCGLKAQEEAEHN